MTSTLPSEAGVLTRLPEEMQYLAEAACKYRLETEGAALSFVQHATEADLNELAGVAEKVLLRNHYPQINAFLKEYPIDSYDECAWLYFLFGAMDYAELRFD